MTTTTTTTTPSKFMVRKYLNGDVYEGEMLNDKIHGKGLLKYRSGALYEGEFVDEKRHGKGIFVWSNGDVFEGEYQDNSRNGFGVYKYFNGDMYVGYYKNNKQDSAGIHIAKGVMRDDYQFDTEKNGKGLYRYSTGDTLEVEREPFFSSLLAFLPSPSLTILLAHQQGHILQRLPTRDWALALDRRSLLNRQLRRRRAARQRHLLVSRWSSPRSRVQRGRALWSSNASVAQW